MPVSLELTIPSTHRIGTEVGRALMPMGNEIITQLRRIDENIQYYTDLFRPLPDQLGASVSDGMQRLSIRVFETNETMLDHIEAMRWAIAYLSYNLMVDVWWLLNAMYAREGQILEAIRALRGDLAAIGYELTAIGNCVCSLLQAILDALRAGIILTGQISITITGGGGGGGVFDFLKDISLWRLLAFLAILAGFVAALGLAMNLFTLNALIAATAIGMFVAAIIPLLDKLAGFDWPTIGKIAVGLAALAGFVAALGYALKPLTKEVADAIPKLNSLIAALGDLATKLAGLSFGSMLVLAGALAALAGFVYALAVSLSKLSAETLKALGPLSEFIDHLGAFAVKLAALSLGQVLALGGALLALGLFVNSLAGSLSKLTAETLKALGPLSEFIDHLGTFAVKLAALSAGDVVVLGLALLALAEFVSSLASSLAKMSVDLLNALPSFTALIGALQSLATAMAGLSVGELITMGVAFALIAGFVWALAAALTYAEGPLKSLASILENTRGLLSDIVNYGDKILEFLGALGGEAEGGGLLEGFLGALGGAALDLLPILLASSGGPGAGAPAAPGGGPGATAGPGEAMVAAAPAAIPALVPPTPGAQAVDASVNVAGGISVAINADRLEADAAELLSDQIIAQLQARLGALRSEQDFRLGARPAAVA